MSKALKASTTQSSFHQGMLSEMRYIHKQRLLALKRSPEFGGSKGWKVFMGIIIALVLLYVASLGILFGILVERDNSVNGYEFIGSIMPIIIVVDFLLRIGIKQTPAQLVKPYLLLPISKYSVINTFLFENLLSPFNFIWQAFFFSYGVVTILPHYGLVNCLILLVVLEIVILINSQFYLLVRSLSVSKSIFWLLPIIVFSLTLLPSFTGTSFDPIHFLKFYAAKGYWLWNNQLLLWTVLLALLALLLVINGKVQHMIIRNELEAVNNSSSRRIFGISLINSHSEVWLFMRMEVVSWFRNKSLRKDLINCFGSMLVISYIVAFTNLLADIQGFWLFYLSIEFIVTFGIKIMSMEGNYIDCLMVHKSSIYKLLLAKYRLSLLVLIVQFIVILPTVIMGKYTLGDLASCLIFAGGMANFLVFQLAVYNNVSTNFNTKVVGKDTGRSKQVQLVMLFLVFLVPGSIISFLRMTFQPVIANAVLSIIGLAFTLTNRLWIRNIVRRMVKRKYINLEGFRSTRSHL